MISYRLVGECNRCGLCCAPVIDGRRYPCEYLEVSGELGQPAATRCKVYAIRRQGMPIHLLDPATGAHAHKTHCCKDSAEEDIAIMTNGVGKGCSLTPEAMVLG